MRKLISKEDASVNFVFDNGQESRFVQRSDDYFIIYLSTHNGCNKSCRFCHLTQTHQTSFVESSIEDLIDQTNVCLDHYDELIQRGQPRSGKVNINFMARGEPLDSSVILKDNVKLFQEIEARTNQRGLKTVFNLSSIMPKTLEKVDLVDCFSKNHFEKVFFYSLYSTNPEFRKRWIPKAMDPNQAIHQLKSLFINQNQKNYSTKLALHWAWIKNANDRKEDWVLLKKFLEEHQVSKMDCKINMVRYNPFSTNQGQESEESRIIELFNETQKILKHPDSRIVPRVGFDVKASCGMFISENQ